MYGELKNTRRNRRNLREKDRAHSDSPFIAFPSRPDGVKERRTTRVDYKPRKRVFCVSAQDMEDARSTLSVLLWAEGRSTRFDRVWRDVEKMLKGLEGNS